jgi:hypothetical protein
MGWVVSFEAAGEPGAVLDDALEELVDLLADRGGAVSASQARDRYGALFSVDEPLDSVVDALALGHEVFTALAEKAGLPAWPVARADAMTYEEQDRELAAPNFPELVGVSEVAGLLGVTRQRASALAKSPAFPAPVAVLAAGPVWTRPSLNHFVEDWPRKNGRPTKPEPETSS